MTVHQKSLSARQRSQRGWVYLFPPEVAQQADRQVVHAGVEAEEGGEPQPVCADYLAAETFPPENQSSVAVQQTYCAFCDTSTKFGTHVH